MNKIIRILSIALFSLLFLSCEDEGPIDPYAPYPEFKYPLKTGYQWVYEEEHLDWVNDKVEKSGKIKVVTVGNEVKLFGKRGFEINTIITNSNGTKEKSKKYAYVDLNGYYEYDPAFFDIAVQVADTVERSWVKIFRRLDTSSSPYWVRNEASESDTARFSEASYYVDFQRNEDYKTYDNQDIKVRVVKISIFLRKALRSRSLHDRAHIEYKIHEKYGIISELKAGLFGNEAWRWVLKSKNF